MKGIRPEEPDALREYYRRRAAEYDRIYAKPERQGDLRALEGLVGRWLAGRRVLELACGTGWWTAVASRTAASVVATDANDEVLAIARRRDGIGGNVEFRLADAWSPEAIPGEFDAILAAFWISHVPRARLAAFVDALDGRLRMGGRIVLLDNRFVAGSSTPVSRTDQDGDTWQVRRLDDGTETEIRKNFLSAGDLRRLLDARDRFVEVRELRHFWAAVRDRPGPF